MHFLYFILKSYLLLQLEFHIRNIFRNVHLHSMLSRSVVTDGKIIMTETKFLVPYIINTCIIRDITKRFKDQYIANILNLNPASVRLHCQKKYKVMSPNRDDTQVSMYT